MLTEGKDLLVLTTEKPSAKYYLVSASPTMTARGQQCPIYSNCSERAHFSWTGFVSACHQLAFSCSWDTVVFSIEIKSV